MATKIIMPQAGQDITEGLVVRWLKREGESIREGEVLCEVETEKAVFEVESPVDGVLLKIVAQEGERVPIYTTIGIVGAPGEKAELDPLLTGVKKAGPGIDVAAIRKRLEAGAQRNYQSELMRLLAIASCQTSLLFRFPTHAALKIDHRLLPYSY